MDIDSESVKSLMDVMLINALLLGGVLTVMTSVDHDTLIKQDQRFHPNAYGVIDYDPKNITQIHTKYHVYWNTWYKIPPSQQFYYYVSTGLGLLFINIMIVGKRSSYQIPRLLSYSIFYCCLKLLI